MDASKTLWDGWREQVKQLVPTIHGHQKKTLALFVLGAILAGSVVMQRVAESISLAGINPAKMPSIERRLVRFLANERIVVTEVWKRFMQEVLPFWRTRQVSVVLDCTPIDDRACVVYLGLLVQSRLLPIAWRVMPNQETWDQGQWSLVAQLLDQVRAHLPKTDCTLIADRGLTGFSLVQLCRDREWHYLLRVCKEHTCRRQFRRKWQWWTPLSQIILHEGQQWFGRAQMWQEDTIETYVSAGWEPGHKEPWFLISDRRACPRRVQEYAWRMRVESTFEDFKSRGWNLEATKVSDRARLDRLLLVLCVAIWWLTHLAASCIHHGHRHRFDRHDRRDKGIFRLGRLWLLDILRRASNAGAILSCLPFQRKPSGWTFALRF
jgi:hypothetical protein